MGIMRHQNSSELTAGCMWQFGRGISSVVNSVQPHLGQRVTSSPVQRKIQSASVFGSFGSGDKTPQQFSASSESLFLRSVGQ